LSSRRLSGSSQSAAASNISRVPCPSCPETFARAEHLARHLRKHTGEKPFFCSWCGKQFARSDSMKRHESLHSTSNKRKKGNSGQPIRPSTILKKPQSMPSEQGQSMTQPVDYGWGAYTPSPTGHQSADSSLPDNGDMCFSSQNPAQVIADLTTSIASDFNWRPVSEYRGFGTEPGGYAWDSNAFNLASQHAIDPRLTGQWLPMTAPIQGHFLPVANGRIPGDQMAYLH